MRKRVTIGIRASLLAGVSLFALIACDEKREAMQTGTNPGGRAVSGAITGAIAEAKTASASAPTVAPAPAPVARSAMRASSAMTIRREGAVAGDRAFTASPALPSGDASGAMLIRHGQASVEVKHVDDAVTKARQTAAQFGGFVAATSLRSGKDEQRAATLELRVPTGQFDALVASLSAFGRVESVSATVQDVGEEYVDITARAANARRLEARLVEMLGTRTGKLSEVLTVEQELTRVREEIERYEGRLKWLERRTALSSLELSLHEPLPLLDREPGRGPIAEAFAEAWTRAVRVLAWCIASLGVLLPLGVLIGAGVLVARRVLRPGTPPGVSGA
jgi:hypothetical protein